jgi:hypothetical protein
MSHFTVLVPASDEADLSNKLLPYYEYGCSAELDILVQPYLEFEVEVPKEGITAKAAELTSQYGDEFKDGMTAAQIMHWYYGGEANENGDWGHWRNPNAKWDWYQVGGRWTGLLKLKETTLEAVEASGDGSPGLMTPYNDSVDHCDYTLAGLVNWDGILADQEENSAASWDRWAGLLSRYVEISHWFEMDSGQRRELWERIRVDIYGTEDSPKMPSDDEQKLYRRAIFFEPEGETREAHTGKRSALTFAFIDLEGKWNQRGQMGWWGIVSDERADYDEVFWQFIKSLPADQRIYAVDCHI